MPCGSFSVFAPVLCVSAIFVRGHDCAFIVCRKVVRVLCVFMVSLLRCILFIVLSFCSWCSDLLCSVLTMPFVLLPVSKLVTERAFRCWVSLFITGCALV